MNIARQQDFTAAAARWSKCFPAYKLAVVGISNITSAKFKSAAKRDMRKGASMNPNITLRVEAFVLAALLLAVPAYAAMQNSAATPGAGVDGAKIANADADPGEWLSHGRTYSEQRFSPLAKIDTTNVKQLGVAWEYRT